MKINFFNKTLDEVTEYKKLIRKVLKREDTEGYFNIIFVEKDEIQQINKEYRGIDKVTDVITFALKNDLVVNLGDELELGDVFICLDRAKEQAADYGHSIEREVGFLAVHGYLHLLGYDHMNEIDEKRMFEKQDEILNKAKLVR